MPNFYLDIETTGVDPRIDKIITIQFAELDRNTGKQIGELKILKEWESSEKEIIRQFILESSITSSNPWIFVPVGYNLNFEHKFLAERCTVNGIESFDILNKPFIDLRPFGIIMNKGEFKGSGLDRITGKPHSGAIIPQWYKEKKYSDIENYIKTEFSEFVAFGSWLYRELPDMLAKFKNSNHIE